MVVYGHFGEDRQKCYKFQLLTWTSELLVASSQLLISSKVFKASSKHSEMLFSSLFPSSLGSFSISNRNWQLLRIKTKTTPIWCYSSFVNEINGWENHKLLYYQLIAFWIRILHYQLPKLKCEQPKPNKLKRKQIRYPTASLLFFALFLLVFRHLTSPTAAARLNHGGWTQQGQWQWHRQNI